MIVVQRKGKNLWQGVLCLPRNLNHRVRNLQKSEQTWGAGIRKSYRMSLCAKEFNFSPRAVGSYLGGGNILINYLRIPYLVF